MSFGVSPSDVIKLVEFSTRIYVAFKDANDNSETVVEGLVKEFSTFHICLVQLKELMTEYGKPLPFPYLDFQETLQRCEKSLKPYANHLVDSKKMTVRKITYTIRYIGKEKEIDGLRKQINGHYQALQMCISFLQLRLHLEATKQTQRLLDSTPMFRTMSLGGHMYTNNAFGGSRTNPAALPAPSEADQLYKDWLIFKRWLDSEDERIAVENGMFTRPLSLGGTPAIAPSGDAETAAVLYHLRRELEDAIMIEENRAKRAAAEKRTTLSPSDAIRQEVHTMPQVPQRTYTLETDFSGNFSGFNNSNASMSGSAATIRPTSISAPPPSFSRSPQIQQSYFHAVDWGSLSPNLQRTPSVSTNRTSLSTSPDSRLSISSAMGLGINTSETTPDDHPLRSKHSVSSLATMALGKGALDWNRLCKRVQVERNSSKGEESKECTLFWRYREDAGISVRSLYKSGDNYKEWVIQHFPATGPSIPLSTTTSFDGELSIDFPRSSFGRLEKRFTNIKYTFGNPEASQPLQTLLYTNNGKDKAELLYDRPIVTISSDKNKPECRGKNIRLWKKVEELEGPNGMEEVEVLVVLFFTSSLQDEKAQHWVEEPHYVFQWIEDSVYKKSSEKLELIFSKDPSKWTRDKLFKRRKTSKEVDASATDEVALALRRTSIQRQNTVSSVASSNMSIKSGKSSIFGSGRPKRTGTLNRFGYSEFKIEFQSKKDCKDFQAVWKEYVKPLGYMEGN